MSSICERCGSCCVQIGYINPREEDIKRWVRGSRYDILEYCEGWQEDCWLWDEQELISYLRDCTNSEMWFDPRTGEELSLCPFLRKVRRKEQFECRIHDTKPLMCQEYICNPKDMKKIIKRSFSENLKLYRKKKRNQAK